MVTSGQLTPQTNAHPAPTGVTALTFSDNHGGSGSARPVLTRAEQLAMVTRGHGAVEVDFAPLPCRPGTLLRLRAGQALRCAPGLDAIVVRWGTRALDGLDVDADALPTYCPLHDGEQAAVRREIEQLAVDSRRHGATPAGQRMLRHQLAVVLLRLTLPARQGASGDRTYRRLRQEVERHYRQTRRVEDYAALLGCSVRTLTRACLAATGRGAKQVVDERVALQARRLLAATDEPVSAIGRQLGFPEATNFGRFFTREVGLSPGAFRAAGGGLPPHGVIHPRSGHRTDRA